MSVQYKSKELKEHLKQIQAKLGTIKDNVNKSLNAYNSRKAASEKDQEKLATAKSFIENLTAVEELLKLYYEIPSEIQVAEAQAHNKKNTNIAQTYATRVISNLTTFKKLQNKETELLCKLGLNQPNDGSLTIQHFLQLTFASLSKKQQNITGAIEKRNFGLTKDSWTSVSNTSKTQMDYLKNAIRVSDENLSKEMQVTPARMSDKDIKALETEYSPKQENKKPITEQAAKSPTQSSKAESHDAESAEKAKNNILKTLIKITQDTDSIKAITTLLNYAVELIQRSEGCFGFTGYTLEGAQKGNTVISAFENALVKTQGVERAEGEHLTAFKEALEKENTAFKSASTKRPWLWSCCPTQGGNTADKIAQVEQTLNLNLSQ